MLQCMNKVGFSDVCDVTMQAELDFHRVSCECHNLLYSYTLENLPQRLGRKTLTNWERNPSTHSRYLKLLKKISSRPRDLGWVTNKLILLVSSYIYLIF